MPDSMVDEVYGARFGDRRLTKRLYKIVEQLGAKPNMCIPAATDSRAEMEATYRFYNNSKVAPDAIYEPHSAATQQRISQCPVVVMVQDTTELDLTRPTEQVDGAGPMETESRLGVFYHPLIAFTTESVPLGTVWRKTWARESIRSDLTPAEKQKLRKATPIEDKESIRWLEGVRAARKVAEANPQTQCVCVADSEADMYEWFVEPRSTSHGCQLQMLVRACYDRSLSGEKKHLLDTVRATPCLYQCSVSVSSRKAKSSIETRKRNLARDARIAEVEVRATTVTLRPPPRPDRKFPAVTLNVVLVEEKNPPTGEEPIQWLLLTTLPIEDIEQVRLIVQYYCIRWQIEVYFRTLKSGCRIEKRYFERVAPLLNCLAVYAIVAWKVLYLCRLSRECPDLSCEVVFTTSEWKSVYMTVRRTEPTQPPTLNEMIRMIASLGGYVIRKKTQPGTQTLWIGLQRLHDLSTAWQTFGPGAET